MSFISTAFAQSASGETASQFQSLGQFLPLAAIIAVMYFFMIRPQMQKAKQLRTLQDNLRRGDRVVTSGGIIGTVSRIIDNDEVEVQIAESVRVRVVRSTITAVTAKSEPAGKDKTEAAPESGDDGKAEGDGDSAKRTRRRSTGSGN